MWINQPNPKIFMHLRILRGKCVGWKRKPLRNIYLRIRIFSPLHLTMIFWNIRTFIPNSFINIYILSGFPANISFMESESKLDNLPSNKWYFFVDCLALMLHSTLPLCSLDQNWCFRRKSGIPVPLSNSFDNLSLQCEHFQAMIMYVHTFVTLLPCHLSDERECHQIDLLFQIQPEAVVIYAKNRQSTWFFHFD